MQRLGAALKYLFDKKVFAIVPHFQLFKMRNSESRRNISQAGIEEIDFGSIQVRFVAKHVFGKRLPCKLPKANIKSFILMPTMMRNHRATSLDHPSFIRQPKIHQANNISSKNAKPRRCDQTVKQSQLCHAEVSCRFAVPQVWQYVANLQKVKLILYRTLSLGLRDYLLCRKRSGFKTEKESPLIRALV